MPVAVGAQWTMLFIARRRRTDLWQSKKNILRPPPNGGKRGTAIKQGAKNKEPEMTMEEYLLSQLDTPVVLN